MVTTNAARAVYIVYSLMTIPIMTILISLMSDAFLSRFQKSAEKFGVRGGEDQRYIAHRDECRRNGPRWRYYTRKVFHRRSRPAESENAEIDVEQGPDMSNMEDELLRETVMEEMESIRQSVDVEDESLTDRAKSSVAIRQRPSVGSPESSGTCRRRMPPYAVEDDLDEDLISEADVDKAIKDSRGDLDEE